LANRDAQVPVRRSPEPERLRWAPEIPFRFVDIDGMRLRYIATGAGPALVLLHTLRTQLDIFEPMVPALARHFTVYALDYPGHGYSDAPSARYDAAFFSAAVEAFLERIDLQDVTLAGISIGGVIGLILAARHNPRVSRVISINPYDYGAGLGLSRSSVFGWAVNHMARTPVLGEIMIPLAPHWLVRLVLSGGVAHAKHLSRELADAIADAEKRPGQAQAFIRLLRNARSWQDAQSEYDKIREPVLLIWSDKDWSRLKERARTAALIPNVVRKSVSDGGHFLSLDQPEELTQLILEFAKPKTNAPF
jgi:pimeloyl-ACP methyl ester carboxylesterase